jgi:DNA mismatch repair protein MutL
MTEIVRLPPDLVNKIAAGEVVERPASVAKELLENAIDAGAASITIEVRGGGVRLIRVTDDGRGMDREDALLAVEPHATSKLRTADDLWRITTLGFRGEALASIAAVSRLSIETARRGEQEGVRVEVEGGVRGEVRATAARGTVVEVRDLFFNTPARAKFLKRESTELYHILDTATRLALAYPAVGFRVLVEGAETISMGRAASERERIGQVYGIDFLDGLIELRAEAGGLALHAFVSLPANVRETRSHQMVFIGGRSVRDTTISHAVQSCYAGLIPEGAHPLFIAYLTVDPASVDVNVHPSKREVRFSDREGIHRFVRRAVRDRLAGLPGAPPVEGAPGGAPPAVSSIAPGAPAPVFPAVFGEPGGGAMPPTVAESLAFDMAVGSRFVYLGETFVALPSRGGGLTLLDHHAAHERVLYERLLGGGFAGSELLFPPQVRLGPSEYRAVLAGRELLAEMGIAVEDWGGGAVLVRTLPEELEGADVRAILDDAARAMIEGERPGRGLRERVAARVACHGSVRGRTVLAPEAIEALLRDLDRAERPDVCPHGRPTRVFLSTDDLRKMFGRT